MADAEISRNSLHLLTVKKIWRALFLALLALVSMWDVRSLSRGVETSLTALVGGDHTIIQLSEQTANTIRVMCSDAARAQKCRAIFPFDAPFDFAKFLDRVRTHGKGLLTAQNREALAKNDFAKIERRTKRRDHLSVGLFTKEEDPHYFLNDFVLAWRDLKPAALPENAEVLSATCDMTRPDTQQKLRELLALAEHDDGIALSGAPFHTLLATDKTKSEINCLGALSLTIVFLCGFCLFRSVRFIVPTACALASGFLCATAAVCALPGRPHALTFLFGTTLLGLGVDYCYHTLADAHREKFFAKLSHALATTTLAFSPLLFSGVHVLREMAVFTIVGLLSIYFFAILFLSAREISSSSRKIFALPWLSRIFSRKIFARIFLFANFAIFAILTIFAIRNGFRLDNNPANFHAPAPVMARGEAALAKVTDEATARLVLVPLAKWQEENAALKSKIEPLTGEFLSARDCPAFLVFTCDGVEHILLPKSIAGDGYASVNPKQSLAELFAKLSRETYFLLACSFAIFFIFSIAIFRARVLRIILPVVSALFATAILHAALGKSFTFFHALCFFILLGLGIDYAIFHQGADDKNSRKIIFFSFLTSFAGFGLLAFTSFPVTRAIGETLASGLFFAYFFSFLHARFAKIRDENFREKKIRENEHVHWAQQREQSAGTWRILFLVWLMRVCGKSIAKILFFPVFIFIYPFCRPARAALREYYAIADIPARPFRHILNFAWSMFDKMDACSCCRNPPRLTLTGETDWMRGGCFLLSTHIGCIEVLPAMRARYASNHAPKVHAFQQMSHNAIFTKIFAKNSRAEQLTLHAVEEIGVETSVEMKDAIARGEIVLMAGDRVSAGSSRNFAHDFLGRACVWPKGVFRFAKMMECPIFAIVCAQTRWNDYEIFAKKLSRENLLDDYIAFLEMSVRKFPYQWFQFYPFFSAPAKTTTLPR